MAFFMDFEYFLKILFCKLHEVKHYSKNQTAKYFAENCCEFDNCPKPKESPNGI